MTTEPEADRFEVQYRPLRGAVDWLRALNRNPIPPEKWGPLAARKQAWTIGGRLHADAITLERHGTQSPDAHRIEFRAPGVRVVVRHAERLDDRHPYAVEIDFQGAILSTTPHGVEAIDALMPLFHADLYPEPYALGETWTPGRTDLAADVAISGPDRDAWIERGFFHSGNHSQTAADFATRASGAGTSGNSTAWINVDAARGLGSAPGGRTFYLGRSPMLRIYERDKHAGGDWPQVRPMLEQMGWNPKEDRLLRVEYQITRKWIVQQTDGHTRGSDLTLGDWLGSIPALWRELMERTRHTEGANSRPSDRDDSEFWTAAHRAIENF